MTEYLTSRAPIFLPRYSGVRPIISPPMNTAMHDVEDHAVQAAADSSEDDLADRHVEHRRDRRRAAGMSRASSSRCRSMRRSSRPPTGPTPRAPIRTSLPSMFGSAAATPAARIAPEEVCSDGTVSEQPGDDRARTSRRTTPSPCRTLPTILPNVYVSAAGIARIASISRKFENGPPPSNGCAEFDVEEPAAVRAELLDRDLPGDRTARDGPARSPARRWRPASPRASGPRPGSRGRAPSGRRSGSGCRRCHAPGRARSCPSSSRLDRVKPRIIATSDRHARRRRRRSSGTSARASG